MTTTTAPLLSPDQHEMRDILIARGVYDPKASELAVTPGMCAEIIHDAFRRAKPTTEPILIAANLAKRAAARLRVLDRDGTAETHDTVEKTKAAEHAALLRQIETETIDRNRYLDAVPAEKLKEFVAEVKKKHTWIKGDDPKDNTMLGVLILDHARDIGYNPGSLYG